jgi:hypothetical protein
MADDLVRDVTRDWERLDGDRGTWKSHCQQVARYLDPDRADFTTTREPGAKRAQWVFDATPLFAHEMGAAGFHSMLTSDALPWFSTQPDDDKLKNDYDAMSWFQAADAADYNVFNNPERNFATQSHQVYLDTLAYGAASMFTLDTPNGILFTNRHLKEVCFAENEEDRVDQISRRWEWTAGQAWRQWGPAAGEKVAKAIADKNEHNKFIFHHRIRPRALDQRDPTAADPKKKKFESVYVSEADNCIVAESGFDEFPAQCPRLSKRAVQDVMGRGRGYMMLADIQMLNALARVIVRGAEKIIDPPLMVPDDGFVVPIQAAPGAFLVYRAGLRPTDRISPLETHANIPVGEEMLLRLEQKIEKGFFNNLLQTPTDPTDPASAGKGVTATFVQRQWQEQMRALSPLNARLNAEWTAPLVLAVRRINWQKSVARRFGPGSPYPPPPDVLRGSRWHAEFKSPIALAQRAAEMTAIDQLWQRQLLLRQIDPEGPMVLDAEATIRREARDLNAPLEILKSPRLLQAERARQAQMVQRQHEAEVAQKGSQAAANLVGAAQQAQPLMQEAA